MNEQAPGPLQSIPGEPYREFSRVLVGARGALGHSPKESEAVLGYTRYRPEDAALVAAAYTAFDKAGRELGIDATALASRINLVELIRAAHEAGGVLMNKVPDTEERRAAYRRLNAVLSALPEIEISTIFPDRATGAGS